MERSSFSNAASSMRERGPEIDSAPDEFSADPENGCGQRRHVGLPL